MRSDNPANINQEPAKKTDSEKALSTVGKLNEEMFNTEQTFLDSIKALCKVMDKFKQDISKLLSKKDLRKLNSFLEPFREMAASNNVFPESLKDATIPAADGVSKVLDAMGTPDFQKHVKSMRAVTINYSGAEDFFNKFVVQLKDAVEKKNKSTKTLTELEIQEISRLPSYIIQPVQRLPRYNLLLGEINRQLGKVTDQDQKVLMARVTETDAQQKIFNLGTNREIALKNLQDIIQDLKDFTLRGSKIPAEKNPEIRKLNDLEASIKTLETPDELDKAAMKFYADTYMDYRSKGMLGGTEKDPFLRRLEKAFIDSPIFKITQDSKKSNAENILNHINSKASVRDAVVEHLFTRAMAEGVGLGNRQIYANAVKEVGRMGSINAVNNWNNLVEKFGKADVLKMAQGETSDSAINAQYDNNIKTNGDLINRARNSYTPEILIQLLKNNRPINLSEKELKHLDILAQKLEQVKSDSGKMHQLTMDLYSDSYAIAKLENKGGKKDSPIIGFLENAMKESGITAKLNASEPNLNLTNMVLSTFLDTYLEDRKKTGILVGNVVTKSPFLSELEESMVEVFNLPKGSNLKNTELILQYAALPKGATEAMVGALFDRAMAEGVSQKEKMIYANAAKMVNEMGNNAMKEWNKLVTDKFVESADDLKFPQDKNGNFTAVSGKEIADSYEKAMKQEHVVRNVKKFYAPQILINVLKTSDHYGLDRDQSNQLQDLIKNLELHKNDQRMVHQVFMDAYLDVYINENKQGNNKFLKFLEGEVNYFNKTSGSSMFAGETVKKGFMKEYNDAMILSSAANLKFSSPEDTKALSTRAFDRAVEELQIAAALDEKDPNVQKHILRAVMGAKAVVRMTRGAVENWEALVNKNEIDEMSILRFAQKNKDPEAPLKISDGPIKKAFNDLVQELRAALVAERLAAQRASVSINPSTIEFSDLRRASFFKTSNTSPHGSEESIEEKDTQKDSTRMNNK